MKAEKGWQKNQMQTSIHVDGWSEENFGGQGCWYERGKRKDWGLFADR